MSNKYSLNHLRIAFTFGENRNNLQFMGEKKWAKCFTRSPWNIFMFTIICLRINNKSNKHFPLEMSDWIFIRNLRGKRKPIFLNVIYDKRF